MPLNNITRPYLTFQDLPYRQYLLCLKCQQLNTANISFHPLPPQHFLRYYQPSHLSLEHAQRWPFQMMPQGHIVETSLFQIVSFYSVIGLYDVFHRFLIMYSSTPSLKEFRLRIGLYLDFTCFCIIAGFCLSLPTPYFLLISSCSLLFQGN